MRFFLFLFLLAETGLFSQQTEIYIGLNSKAPTEKAVYLSNFSPKDFKNAKDAEIAVKARDIIRYDLLYSRYFRINEDPLNPLSLKNDGEALAFFSKNSEYLFWGEAGWNNETDFYLKGQIYDLKTKNRIFEKTYTGKMTSLRKATHMLADEAIFKMTGRTGIAHSKIAFSNNSTGSKEIYISDYDGENLLKATNDKSISILPRWSQDASRIYYTTFRYKNPDIFEIDFRQGKIRPFTVFQGLNLPGGISPTGEDLAMTLSRGADPSIYVMNLQTKGIKKLLSNFGVSSSPTYSPDNKELAFVSDLSGNPQLYIYNFETKKTRKITRLNWTDSPSWSPTGQWIAFSGRGSRKEKMNIFLVDPTGSQIKRLTRNEGDNEDPSFSPDGRFIVFTSTRRGRREIFIMDYDGSAAHPLVETLKGDSFTPDWSK